MAFIPEQKIQEIKAATRIEEVIGTWLQLRKSGVNQVGNCPYCGETKKRFSVSPTKGIFKCFKCDKSGTAITYLMDQRQMTYPEALKYLAEKFNVLLD